MPLCETLTGERDSIVANNPTTTGEPGPDLMSRLDAFLGPVLADVEKIFAEELDSRQACVRDVYMHITRFRGKRLRPVLVLLSAAATGEINHDHKVLAAVVEMIHTATLVHDDVLDDADTRRHVATVNARWNNETSVLFGDYLFTHAFHLAASLSSTRACRLIGKATNVVCEGELTQISERGNFDLTEDRYLEIINGKTAELCAVSCQLGALHADATEEQVIALAEYGRALGMAFQIADDVLDLMGTEDKTGKSLGTDLQKQKLTLPLIRLLHTITDDDADRVRQLLSHPDEDTARTLLPMLLSSDALDYTHMRAQDFAAAARGHLSELPETPAKAILIAATNFVAQRSC